MAVLVTRPVEEAIRATPGVLNVRSRTTRGSSQISIDFGWGRDMVAATLNVNSAIAKVLPGLPAGTRYDVRRMDPTVFPIISYALLSNNLSPVALRDLASIKSCRSSRRSQVSPGLPSKAASSGRSRSRPIRTGSASTVLASMT